MSNISRPRAGTATGRGSAPLTAIVSFCSNDWRFLEACIAGIRPISQQILITVCDHFFDGAEENYALLQEAFSQFPDCTFLLFDFDSRFTYRYASPLFPDHPDWRREWHNTGRFLSFYFVHPTSEYLLFLDSDEIVDGERFAKWLDGVDNSNTSACRFFGYRHFREAKYVAKQGESLGLFLQKKLLNPEWLWDSDERMGVFSLFPGKKEIEVLGVDNLPLLSHYTGVRTRQELYRKCAAWGHHWERDWESLINREFSQPFTGADFFRSYTYGTKNVRFDPLLVKIPQLPVKSLEQFRRDLHHFPHVIPIGQKEAFKRQLAHAFTLH